ncbi:MAG: hypothetical protein QM811_22985 [Pirellulales bacterium]
MTWPRERLDPPPLLTGNDLIRGGWKPGPAFARTLKELRDAQLDDVVKTPDDARTWVAVRRDVG